MIWSEDCHSHSILWRRGGSDETLRSLWICTRMHEQPVPHLKCRGVQVVFFFVSVLVCSHLNHTSEMEIVSKLVYWMQHSRIYLRFAIHCYITLFLKMSFPENLPETLLVPSGTLPGCSVFESVEVFPRFPWRGNEKLCGGKSGQNQSQCSVTLCAPCMSSPYSTHAQGSQFSSIPTVHTASGKTFQYPSGMRCFEQAPLFPLRNMKELF